MSFPIMPVTLAMARPLCFLLFISLWVSCHSPVLGPEKYVSEPFDRHAPLVFTRHARCRMDCRHITGREIQEILGNGQINLAKSEPDARPDPKWAVEGYTEEQQHLRIIVAPEPGKLVIITCIELGVEWNCHCN